MTVAALLPMAVVMVAGPQILSAVFLATSENWRRNSAAFLLGAACSVTTVVTAAFLLGSGASRAGSPDEALYVVVLVLLVAAMVRTYLGRHDAEPPTWMDRLRTATPRFSFALGFLLLGVFPTDILTSAAMGTYLAAHGAAWWQGLPFVALTLLLLAIPAVLLLALGERGEALLPKVRTWMTSNAWVVNELVLLLFVALTVRNLRG